MIKIKSFILKRMTVGGVISIYYETIHKLIELIIDVAIQGTYFI